VPLLLTVNAPKKGPTDRREAVTAAIGNGKITPNERESWQYSGRQKDAVVTADLEGRMEALETENFDRRAGQA
jgi:hypothetical protein